MQSSLDLALKLSRQRNIRPPERFNASEPSKKPPRKLTCPCGAKSEPTSMTRFTWCDKCRVFVSNGGLVRCMCGLAMPPNADENNGANNNNNNNVVVVDVERDFESDDDLVDWIQCDRCKHFLHVSCVFGPLAAENELSQQEFVCALCDDDKNAAEQQPVVKEQVEQVPIIVVEEEEEDDDEEDAADESAPKRFWVCGVDGCDFCCAKSKTMYKHRDWGHPDRVVDNSVRPRVAMLPPTTQVTCRFCGAKKYNNGLLKHISLCEKAKQLAHQPAPVAVAAADAEAPEPQQARKRARTTTASSTAAVAVAVEDAAPVSSSVSAFPESATRVLGSAADAALEMARRGVLLRKIRAVLELDEAFLQTMNARYTSHKLANEV